MDSKLWYKGTNEVEDYQRNAKIELGLHKLQTALIFSNKFQALDNKSAVGTTKNSKKELE